MPPASHPERRRRLPPPLLPLLYFGAAHLSLAVAFAVLALAPESVAGFFYHPRMVFVVHLVTLGWITSSILGALHLVGPMALGAPMPEQRLDYAAFGLWVLGASGAIFHFWIDELSGVGLSGLLVMLVVGQIGVKFLVSLAGAKVPRAVKAHFVLAFFNFFVAAAMGVLLALNKLVAFLPGSVMTNVYAHAHLAALGWATMTVFAAGYRLLPMLLPSAMPRGVSVWAGAVVFEGGVLGLSAALFLRSRSVGLFAVLTVAGIAVFFAQVAWMRRHPRPAPKALVRPDWGVAQALLALGYLGAAAVLGLVLAFAPTTQWTLRLAAVYGICSLVGFLAQIVVGFSTRLIPIYSWFRAYSAAPFEPPPASPHALGDRRLQAATFLLWTLGVPLLAGAFLFERPAAIALAGWLLLAAVVTGGAGQVVVLSALRR